MDQNYECSHSYGEYHYKDRKFAKLCYLCDLWVRPSLEEIEDLVRKISFPNTDETTETW